MSRLMRSTTVLLVLVFMVNPLSVRSILRRTGLERERMQLIAHAAAQRLIDHLMLLHAGLALEGARDDMGGVMIAVAAQILDAHLRVRQTILDQPLDRRRIHRHENASGRDFYGAAI